MTAPEDHTPAIPRQVFQYWEGDLPADVGAAMDRIPKAHPQARYHRFTQAEAWDYLHRHGTADIRRAFLLARHPAERADLFRLVLLLHEGGIYLDADDICKGDLWDVLPPQARLVLYQEEIGAVGNNFIAAAPGDPVLAETLTLAVAETLAGASETIWLRTGPGAVTRALARRIARDPGIRLPEGYHVLDRAALERRSASCRKFSYKTGNLDWARAEAEDDLDAS